MLQRNLNKNLPVRSSQPLLVAITCTRMGDFSSATSKCNENLGYQYQLPVVGLWLRGTGGGVSSGLALFEQVGQREFLAPFRSSGAPHPFAERAGRSWGVWGRCNFGIWPVPDALERPFLGWHSVMEREGLSKTSLRIYKNCEIKDISKTLIAPNFEVKIWSTELI
jgi:hypothetical protein